MFKLDMFAFRFLTSLNNAVAIRKAVQQHEECLHLQNKQHFVNKTLLLTTINFYKIGVEHASVRIYANRLIIKLN